MFSFDVRPKPCYPKRGRMVCSPVATAVFARRNKSILSIALVSHRYQRAEAVRNITLDRPLFKKQGGGFLEPGRRLMASSLAQNMRDAWWYDPGPR